MGTPAKRRLVLISDDDALCARSLTRLLRERDIETVTDCSSDVVRLAETLHPTLILLDLNQKVDGRTLLARLQWNKATRSIPVVVVSGIHLDQVQKYCLALGALKYVTKPIDAELIKNLTQLPVFGPATKLRASNLDTSPV